MRLLTATSLLTLLLITTNAQASSGGIAYSEEARPIKAKINDRGRATIDDSAPEVVKNIIKAGNRLIGKPYRYGGGHARFRDSGYDCSGSVSYALRGGKLVERPLNSTALAIWGEKGRGQWLTVYANSGHAFLEIAGIRLDTSAAGDPRGRSGPRWRPALKSKRGYRARHASGL